MQLFYFSIFSKNSFARMLCAPPSTIQETFILIGSAILEIIANKRQDSPSPWNPYLSLRLWSSVVHMLPEPGQKSRHLTKIGNPSNGPATKKWFGMHIVANIFILYPKYLDSTYQVFYSLKWSEFHHLCDRWHQLTWKFLISFVRLFFEGVFE